MRRVFGGLVSCIVAYEIVALRNRNSRATISEICWDLSKEPLFPFLCGMIAGHLFWKDRSRGALW